MLGCSCPESRRDSLFHYSCRRLIRRPLPLVHDHQVFFLIILQSRLSYSYLTYENACGITSGYLALLGIRSVSSKPFLFVPSLKIIENNKDHNITKLCAVEYS